MKTAYPTYKPMNRLHRWSFLRAAIGLFAALALSSCGWFGMDDDEEDRERGYSIGEQERLRFYFQHAFRGRIAPSEGIPFFESGENNHGDSGIARGAPRRVLSVRDAVDPRRTLPELHFESEDTSIFEVEAYGCTPDEKCVASTCAIDHDRYPCDAPDVYRVRLGLFDEGVGRLIVRDAEGEIYDRVGVRIYAAEVLED